MSEARQARKMDAQDLYRALDQFYGDNSQSYSLEYRWLVQQTIPLKNLAYQLYANGSESFQKANHQSITALRLAEIEAKRAEIAKADAKLEDEAKLLKRKTAA